MIEVFVSTLVKSIDFNKLLASAEAKQALANVETIKAAFLRIQEQNDLIIARLDAIEKSLPNPYDHA